MNKRIRVLFGVFLLIFSLPFAFWRLITYADQAIVIARSTNKFDEKNRYRIIETNLWQEGGPIVYGLIKPGEATEAAALAYRRIGDSKIDLRQYLNTDLYIKGEYYMGQPTLIRNIDTNVYGIKDEQPVIRIREIKLAKD